MGMDKIKITLGNAWQLIISLLQILPLSNYGLLLLVMKLAIFVLRALPLSIISTPNHSSRFCLGRKIYGLKYICDILFLSLKVQLALILRWAYYETTNQTRSDCQLCFLLMCAAMIIGNFVCGMVHLIVKRNTLIALSNYNINQEFNRKFKEKLE